MSSRPGFYEDDAGGKSAPGGSQQQSKQQAADKQSGKGDKDKSLPTGKGNDQSSGWFGGIWGKLSLKPKNQMILPDDKNPSVSYSVKRVNIDLIALPLCRSFGIRIRSVGSIRTKERRKVKLLSHLLRCPS